MPLTSSNIIGMENSIDRGDDFNLDELQKYIGTTGGGGLAGSKRF
jgi:hypothetical protein